MQALTSLMVVGENLHRIKQNKIVRSNRILFDPVLPADSGNTLFPNHLCNSGNKYQYFWRFMVFSGNT